MTTVPSRAPVGIPTGGQFTISVHEEPDVSLPNADDHADAMAYGAAQYADVLDAFKAEGWDASFNTTGGNCAAIELTLADGAYVLVTDADDALSLDRGLHSGWAGGRSDCTSRTRTGTATRRPSRPPKTARPLKPSCWSVAPWRASCDRRAAACRSRRPRRWTVHRRAGRAPDPVRHPTAPDRRFQGLGRPVGRRRPVPGPVRSRRRAASGDLGCDAWSGEEVAVHVSFHPLALSGGRHGTALIMGVDHDGPMQKRRDMLTELSPKQRDALATHADDWIARGLDTTPADHARVEDGLRRAYEYAGIPWHGNVVWVKSPLAACTTADVVAGAVHDAVRSAVLDAVYGAVDDAVDDAVHGAVGGAVYGAVEGAVGGAVSGAVYDAVHDAWWRYIGGLTWAAGVAYLTYYRDHTPDINVPADTWDRLSAYEDLMSAGWVFPGRTHAVISERPAVIRLEQVGPRGLGSHRLHCADGPALAWGDGWALHYWHGVRVPADLVESGWDVDRILAERNAEVRRCAIERMGWPEFVTAAGLTEVGEPCDDPGNPGHTLRLYDVPSDIYGVPVRILLCDNATPERDGTRRRFGLTVPADIRSALDAAAWTFNLTPSEYAAIQRAC